MSNYLQDQKMPEFTETTLVNEKFSIFHNCALTTDKLGI